LDDALIKIIAAKVAPDHETAKRYVMEGVVGLMEAIPGSTASLKLEAMRALDSLLARYVHVCHHISTFVLLSVGRLYD